MMWSLRMAGVLVICLAGSLPVAAQTFTGVLSGAAEESPNESPGTGPVEVELDAVQHLLRVDVSFSGLLSPTTVAHIHCCAPPGEGAGVATTLPTFPGFPAGVTSGTYQESFDTTQASTFSPAFIEANGGTPAGAEAALLAGLESGMAYFNIHTMMFAAGEIRADLEGGEAGTPTATVGPLTPTGTPPVTPDATATAPPTPDGTATVSVTPDGTATVSVTPDGTATVSVTPDGTATVSVTPEVTATATGETTGTPTEMATASVTTTTRTATPIPTGGSPTVTGTRVTTATVTPSRGTTTASPVRTTTAPAPRDFDDSCHVVAPSPNGSGAWLLLVPAALLLLARRRRS